LRVVIAGGGTAGHVNPAVALAEALTGDEVSFLGTSKGAEARIVPTAGFPLDEIQVVGFDRAKPWTFPRTAGRAAAAVTQARRSLQKREAGVVVGMGGYVSLPAVFAAASLRIPVVLHEQNIVFGLAHRVSKPFARRIAVSFEDTLSQAGKKGVFVGNPVAARFVTFSRAEQRESAVARFGLDPARKTLLVFGGSQGAKRINDAAVGLPHAWSERDDLQVLHIAGASDRVDEDPTGAGSALIYRRVEFVEDMTEAYAVADLALCRGGASTLAEITVVGLPSVIVPYPYHRDRQQERHGRLAESAGAATVLEDRLTTTETIAEIAGALLADDAKLEDMSHRARVLGRPDAARDLAAVVREVAG
jgi:UDP-N-acetylglucosamine--N-acetylmuramyl-(pentapeptide) pyrophosphoryl-undecaprenol N-acetylglucosamine transferase